MATSTAISSFRPNVRTAITISNESVPTPALDWNNGQVIVTSGSSAACSAFDTKNDRLVEASTSAALYYTVGPAATVTAVKGAAGTQYFAAGSLRYIYIPMGMAVAAIQDSAAGNMTLIPALQST